ncbi:AMP-binding protein, partial [Acinetobacter baumannii]
IKTPVNRFLHIVKESEAKLIISGKNFYDFNIKCNINIFNIENLYDYFESNIALANSNESSEAYVIYTSGSTGMPKGVSV